MAEQILPGVSIEVRPEGLIAPGRISVGTIGIVGTASKGPMGNPTPLSSMSDALAVFGEYDTFDSTNPDVLTLVRALELAFANSASNVLAVRIGSGAAAASFLLSSPSGDCVTLAANSEGTWGNDIDINVTAAVENAYVSNEVHNGPAPISLNHPVVVESARNRISVFRDATQVTAQMVIVYGGAPNAGEVSVDVNTGDLTFFAGEEPAGADVLTASYVVAAANSVLVTIRLDTQEETYTVASGDDLIADIEASSALVTAADEANSAELPDAFADASDFRFFGTGANTRGANGEAVTPADYVTGLDTLLNEDAHIIVAAGQTHTTIGAQLTAHCQQASSDLNKHERIGVVGSDLGDSVDDISGHTLNSDRILFVAPGIKSTDRNNGQTVTLSGGYAAAAIAGMLSSFSPHISLTNKPVVVSGLENKYNNGQLIQLVQNRVLALENKFGFRIVKGITSSTNTAWHQITTRRIVDFAKYGVRSAANPYIGLLNNDRVRSAMRSTINSFLTEMVNSEQLVSFEVEVTATREEEIAGIARVTLVLRPTFSIDFIKVTMFLA